LLITVDARAFRKPSHAGALTGPIFFAAMRVINGVTSSLVTMAILAGFTEPAMAQLMSKWGHPAFTVGATPYDSINQGHANYPGSPGFIPGYGSYQAPVQYPWMDGPTMPFDRRQISTPSGPVANSHSSASGLARVVVKLPAEAELWFDDFKTTQRGTYREFIAPINSSSDYTLSVRWQTRGAELTRSERVHLLPGQSLTANFLTVDGWSGRRLSASAGPGPEQLWPPRKMP
jgi:uncharacterized protein (TIGR03000 family)